MRIKSVVRCGALTIVALVHIGCSDSRRNSNENAGAAPGSAGGVASGGGSSAAEGPCRTGAPTDAAPLFQKLGGTYGFSARDKGCDFRGHTYVSPATYRVSVGASPKSVKVSTSTGTELFALSWDEANDVACKDDFSESLVLTDGSDTIRIAFLNGEFSSVSFGQCWFVAD